MFGLDSIIAGLGNIGGSSINAKTALRIANKQMAFNSEQAQIAREWNERMYNQYNSPIAQVQQFKQAGLNPNLLYGNGVQIPQVQSAAQANSGALPVPRPGDAVSGAVQSVLGASLMKAQIENIKADTSKKNSETAGIDIENEINSRGADFRVDLLSKLPDTEMMKQELMAQQRQESVWRSGQIKEFTDKILPMQAEQIGATIRNLDAGTLKTLEEKDYISFNAQTARISANAQMSQARTAEGRLSLEFQLLPYQINLLQSQRNLSDKQAGLVYKQGLKTLRECSNLIKQGESIDLQNLHQRIVNDWDASFGLSRDQFSSLAHTMTNTVFGVFNTEPPTKGRSNVYK